MGLSQFLYPSWQVGSFDNDPIEHCIMRVRAQWTDSVGTRGLQCCFDFVWGVGKKRKVYLCIVIVLSCVNWLVFGLLFCLVRDFNIIFYDIIIRELYVWRHFGFDVLQKGCWLLAVVYCYLSICAKTCKRWFYDIPGGMVWGLRVKQHSLFLSGRCNVSTPRFLAVDILKLLWDFFTI